MGRIQPSLRVEIVFRITAPLPVRVTVYGVAWQFYIWSDDYPPYFSFKLERMDGGAYYAPFFTGATREEVERKACGPIHLDYPHPLIPWIRQLIREGKAEAVWGPHTKIDVR